MALEPLTLEFDPEQPLPPPITDLLQRSRVHERAFQEGLTFQPAGGYLAGDHELAFHGLRALWDRGLLRGPRLCEWGSGLGVVASMAAWLGYEAMGIEVQEALVARARVLAAECGLTVSFATGTFVPEGTDWQPGEVSHLGFLQNPGADGHAALGVVPSDLDVVYCYPWPGDEVLVAALFDHGSSPGAILVTDTGEGTLTFRRKQPPAPTP